MRHILLAFILLVVILTGIGSAHAQNIPVDGRIPRLAGGDWVYAQAPITIAGKAYTAFAYVADASLPAKRMVTLDVQGYKHFSAVAGISDTWKRAKGTVSIHVDNTVVATYTVKSGARAPSIDVPLVNAKTLTIDMQGVVVLAQPMLVQDDIGTRAPVVRWTKPSLTGNLAISPDGKYLACAMGFGYIGIYHTANMKQAAMLHMPKGTIQYLAFSPNGTRLLTMCSVETYVWNTDQWTQCATLPGGHLIVCSPDNRTVAIARPKTGVCLYDIATGELLYEFPEQTTGIYSLCFSGDGKILATLAYSHLLTLWNTDNNTEFKSVTIQPKYKSGLCHIAFTKNSKQLAIANYQYAIILWNYQDDLSTAKPVLSLPDFPNSTTTLMKMEFSPDDTVLDTRYFVLGGASFLSSRNTCSQSFQLATGAPVGFRDERVTLTVLSPDRQYLFSTEFGESVVVQRASDGVLLKRYPLTEQYVDVIAMSANGNVVACANSKSQTITVRLVQDGSVIRTIKGIGSNIRTIALTADGQTMLVLENDGTLTARRIIDAVKQYTFNGKYQCLSTQVIAGKQYIFTTQISGGINSYYLSLWQYTNNQFTQITLPKIPSNPNNSHLHISPDGQYLAMSVSSDSDVEIYHMPDGQKTAVIKALPGNTLTIRGYAADSQSLAISYSKGGTIWHQTSDGAVLRTIPGINSPGLLWPSPDGQWLFGPESGTGLLTRFRVSDGVADHTYPISAYFTSSPDRRTLIFTSGGLQMAHW